MTCSSHSQAHGPQRRIAAAVVGAGLLLAAGGAAAADPRAAGDEGLRALLERAEQQYRAGAVDTLMQRLRVPGSAAPAAAEVPAVTAAQAAAPAMPPSIQIALARLPADAVAATAPAAVSVRAVAASAVAAARPPLKVVAVVSRAVEMVRSSRAAAQVVRGSVPRLDVIAAREIEVMPGTAPDPITLAPAPPSPIIAAPPSPIIAAPPSPIIAAPPLAPRRPATAAAGTQRPDVQPGEASGGGEARMEIRKLTAGQCREILERAQIGSVSGAELQLLRTQCR